MKKSKGQLEAEISTAVTKFEKDYIGRGPKESKSFIIEDMVIIRLKGILTPAEEKLAVEDGGAQLIKQMRMRLIDSSQKLLEEIIEEITGQKVSSLLTDINPKSGERIFIFTLPQNLENQLLKK
ncbi:MAG: DUF2294 domain-containing protein [Calditrichae bacterium]|nr:DUF2294 domain-containing protein [Calditrichota bacterium]MCB9058650.1 DUF2294 domain-containing protein [Calditrichia bacterium]